MFFVRVINTKLSCLQEQEDMIRRHHEELRSLHEKLNLHTDTSLDHFRQTALVRLKPPGQRTRHKPTLGSPKSHTFALLFPLLPVCQELMKKPTLKVATNKHLERLAELEQTVAEQDVSLSSTTGRLNAAAAELERHRASMEAQARKHADEMSK